MPTHESTRRAAILQAVRYLTVAGLVALFYLGLYGGLLALHFQYFVAILIAQVVTILAAFPFYRTFVFRSHGNILADFVRFLSVWLSGAIAGIVVTPILVEFFHVHPFIAQVVSIVIVSVGSFVGHRFFSFRQPIPAADDSSELKNEPREDSL